MSKQRNKGRSELEHLRGENRRLRKLVNHYKRRSHIYTHIEVELEEEEEELDVCQVCKKGIVTEFDFKYITVRSCSACNYEEKIR